MNERVESSQRNLSWIVKLRRQGWKFSVKPLIQKVSFGDGNSIQISLALLILIVLWISISSVIGKNDSLRNEGIIYLCISLYLLLTSATVFFKDKAALVFYSAVSVLPILIVYLYRYQELVIFSIVISIIFILFHLFYWGLGLYQEIENDGILTKLSSISLVLSVFSQIFIMLPEEFKEIINIFFPYFPLVVAFWSTNLLTIVRFIGSMILAIVIVSTSIQGTFWNFKNRDKSQPFILQEFNEFSGENELISLINVPVRVLNQVFIPVINLLIYFIKLSIEILIDFIQNCFHNFIKFCSSSIKISLLLLRFLVIPLAFSSAVTFLLVFTAQSLLQSIHNSQNWLREIQYTVGFCVALALTPFSLLISWEASKILETSLLFIENILFPNVILFALLPVLVSLLMVLGIQPYTFGFLSWISAVAWILVIIRLVQRQRRNG